MLKFFASLPPCLIGIEACASAHHWSRELQNLGHKVKLIAAAALCSTFVDASVPALLLAFAPGGIAEMTIVAFAMGIEVAFVICCHVVRSIFLVAVAPALYRGLHKD